MATYEQILKAKRLAIKVARRRRLLLEAGESPTLGNFTFTSGQTGSTVGFSDAGFYGDLAPKTYLDNTIYVLVATIASTDHIRLSTIDNLRFNSGGTPVDTLTMTIAGAPETSYTLVWGVDYRDEDDARAAALRTYLAAQVGVPLAMTLDIA